MGKTVTNDTRDRILFLVKTMEMNQSQVAREVGFSYSTVNRIVRYYEAAKSGGVDGLCEEVRRSGSNDSRDLGAWALTRAGIKATDADIDKVQNARKVSLAKKTTPQPNVEVVVKEPAPENDLTAFIKLVQQMEVIANQNKVIIETLKRGFESVADAIAALASDIKDNTNLNSDLVCERLKEQTDILNGIKANTRKKGL